MLLGEIDGTAVRASWFLRSLLGTRALIDRGELLVSLGEQLVTEPEGRIIAAGLGTSLAAPLTLVRACDRAVAVRFGPYHLDMPRLGGGRS